MQHQCTNIKHGLFFGDVIFIDICGVKPDLMPWQTAVEQFVDHRHNCNAFMSGLVVPLAVSFLVLMEKCCFISVSVTLVLILAT